MQIIEVGSYIIELKRNDIKTLRLTLYPATGVIRVSAPKHLEEGQIRDFVESRLGWIKQKLASKPEVHIGAEPQYISGETHFLAGKAYTLNVQENACVPKISILPDKIIEMSVCAGTTPLWRKAFMKEWNRVRLEQRIAPLMLKWQVIIGVKPNKSATKQMKTRWGSCNIAAKRIWISLELAKKSDHLLEYIIVHELVHLLERGHNAVFYGYMDKFLPDWRERRKELNGK